MCQQSADASKPNAAIVANKEIEMCEQVARELFTNFSPESTVLFVSHLRERIAQNIRSIQADNKERMEQANKENSFLDGLLSKL